MSEPGGVFVCGRPEAKAVFFRFTSPADVILLFITYIFRSVCLSCVNVWIEPAVDLRATASV